jgi:hypothetical protein
MEMLCRLDTSQEPIDPPLIEHLREHIPSLLTDCTSINIGRHGFAYWVPLVQINTVRFLSLHLMDLDASQLSLVFSDASVHSVQSIARTSASVDARRPAYKLLMDAYANKSLGALREYERSGELSLWISLQNWDPCARAFATLC